MPKYQRETDEKIELRALEKEYIQVLPYGADIEDTRKYTKIDILTTYTSIKFAYKNGDFYYVFVDATKDEILYVRRCLMELDTATCNVQLLKSISKKGFLNRRGIQQLWKISLELACVEENKDAFLYLLKCSGVNSNFFPKIRFSKGYVPIFLTEALGEIDVEGMRKFGRGVYCAYKTYKGVYLYNKGRECEHLFEYNEVFANPNCILYSLLVIGNCPPLVRLLRMRVDELDDQEFKTVLESFLSSQNLG